MNKTYVQSDRNEMN